MLFLMNTKVSVIDNAVEPLMILFDIHCIDNKLSLVVAIIRGVIIGRHVMAIRLLMRLFYNKAD